MDNIITITLDDKKSENRHTIDFQSSPTLSELVAATLVLEECLEHNFDKSSILKMRSMIYDRLEDVEEMVIYDKPKDLK